MSLDAANSTHFSISKLYMWRCIITMAHCDGLVHESERQYLTQIFDNMRAKSGLSQENYILLMSDLSDSQDTFEMLSRINEPAYRGQVTYFARLLAYKDGNLDPSETDLLEKLHGHITEGLDMKAIKQDVAAEVELAQQEIDQRNDALAPQSGLSGLIHKLCDVFDIDLLD